VSPTTTAEFRQRAGLDVLMWPVFDTLGARAVVTTRRGGVSTRAAGDYSSLNLSLDVGDEARDVMENRARAAATVDADVTDLVFASQRHGVEARVVTRADRGRGTLDPASALGPADILVTREPGPVLAILVADCLPIVLLDPFARVLACVHAGWRGTLAGAAGAAVTAMTALGARPGDVIAGLGPAISGGRYEVGADVAASVDQAFGERSRAVLRPSVTTGKWLFDLTAANRLLLADAGVADGHIHAAEVPTGPDPGLFFSHRSRQPCGRFAALARLLPPGEA